MRQHRCCTPTPVLKDPGLSVDQSMTLNTTNEGKTCWPASAGIPRPICLRSAIRRLCHPLTLIYGMRQSRWSKRYGDGCFRPWWDPALVLTTCRSRRSRKAVISHDMSGLPWP